MKQNFPETDTGQKRGLVVVSRRTQFAFVVGEVPVHLDAVAEGLVVELREGQVRFPTVQNVHSQFGS
jgi:hypothetical protein